MTALHQRNYPHNLESLETIGGGAIKIGFLEELYSSSLREAGQESGIIWIIQLRIWSSEVKQVNFPCSSLVETNQIKYVFIFLINILYR